VNAKGEHRAGDSNEAAEWVDYCNNPSNKLRISHGYKEPLTINHWQIGNETSYRPGKGFDNITAAKKTVEFAQAMRKADPKTKLIGWAIVVGQKYYLNKQVNTLTTLPFTTCSIPAKAYQLSVL
jgi:alpha-L-arabinofuranosidase